MADQPSTSGPIAERIGIYGGTFDPVHQGHLILAQDALESLRLSRLIFIPAAVSPHKLSREPGAPGSARLAMLAAAIAHDSRFAVDDCELRRPGPSFAFDTVEILRDRLAAGSELFYLIGEDNVAALATWHRIADLHEMVTFVVFRRITPTLVSPDKSFSNLTRRIDISATEIRKRVASGQSIRYLVPDEVRAIIIADGLYRSPEKGADPLPLKN